MESEDVEQPEETNLRPVPSQWSEKVLHEIFADYRVDTASYGHGNNKTVQELVDELIAGTVTLSSIPVPDPEAAEQAAGDSTRALVACISEITIELKAAYGGKVLLNTKSRRADGRQAPMCLLPHFPKHQDESAADAA